MNFRGIVLCLTLASCTAAFRTSSGGATAHDGVSGGTTNSLYFSDRGGLLTRAGLVGLGLVAAAGAVENARTQTRVSDNNDGTVTVHSETTGTFNAQTAEEAREILDAAADPRQNFGGLTGGLEIASTSLGGDTSGWMFEFGYAYAKTFHNRWGIESSVKLAFGGYTFHGRTIAMFDHSMSNTGVITTTMGDSSYDYVGFPVRFGVTYRVLPHTIVEPFAKLEPNFYPRTAESGIELDPSPWRFGLRLTAAEFLYAEVDARFSAMRESARSYGLEVGFAF